MKDLLPGENTIKTINTLVERGVQRIYVLMRHSARQYSENVRLEPFMGLTDKGKTFALNVGKNLPTDYRIAFYSSYIGRCIETAYLVDKGVVAMGGQTSTNSLSQEISPFYIVDFEKTIHHVLNNSLEIFIREWMSGTIPVSVIQESTGASGKMVTFMQEILRQSPKKTINIGITHDWNLFLLKEKILSQTIEDTGTVAYLESILVYEENGGMYMQNHQGNPVKLT